MDNDEYALRIPADTQADLTESGKMVTEQAMILAHRRWRAVALNHDILVVVAPLGGHPSVFMQPHPLVPKE